MILRVDSRGKIFYRWLVFSVPHPFTLGEFGVCVRYLKVASQFVHKHIADPVRVIHFGSMVIGHHSKLYICNFQNQLYILATFCRTLCWIGAVLVVLVWCFVLGGTCIHSAMYILHLSRKSTLLRWRLIRCIQTPPLCFLCSCILTCSLFAHFQIIFVNAKKRISPTQPFFQYSTFPLISYIPETEKIPRVRPRPPHPPPSPINSNHPPDFIDTFPKGIFPFRGNRLPRGRWPPMGSWPLSPFRPTSPEQLKYTRSIFFFRGLDLSPLLALGHPKLVYGPDKLCWTDPTCHGGRGRSLLPLFLETLFSPQPRRSHTKANFHT